MLRPRQAPGTSRAYRLKRVLPNVAHCAHCAHCAVLLGSVHRALDRRASRRGGVIKFEDDKEVKRKAKRDNVCLASPLPAVSLIDG